MKIDGTHIAFLDTAGWLAMLNVKDSLHRQALIVRDTLQLQRIRVVTTEFVLIEVADAFAAPPLRALAVQFYQGLRQENTSQALDIVPISKNLLARGWNLYSQRPDKEWGLTDCISFVVMQEQGITEAFTSDHHFTQAGFIALLSHKP